MTRRMVLAGLSTLPMLPARAATIHVVEIRKFRFEPKVLTVAPGDRIRWINRDVVPHTATAEDGSWDSGTLKKGAQFEMTVAEDDAGAYYCVLHPHMKALLKIVAG